MKTFKEKPVLLYAWIEGKFADRTNIRQLRISQKSLAWLSGLLSDMAAGVENLADISDDRIEVKPINSTFHWIEK